MTTQASAGKHRRSRRRSRERGISFVEVMVSLALISVIGLIFYQLFIGSMKVTMLLESEGDLMTMGQRVVNAARMEIMQSRALFGDDATGQSYRAAMATSPDAPILTDSELPVIDPNGTIEPDGGTRRTGNMLLFARHLEPTTVPFDHDADSNTPDIDFEADLYRFGSIYQTERTDRSFKETGSYVDLVLAESGEIADFFQIGGLGTAQRTQVALGLHGLGITTAWDPNRPADQAFYTIQSDGSLTGPVSYAIDMTSHKSLIPEFRGGRISGSMNYSLGITTTPPLDTTDTIGLYGQPAGRFPGGLEVLAVGPASSRQVLVRVVLLAEYTGRLSSHENRVLLTTSSF